MPEKNAQEFFVGIENATEVRRDLLESLRTVIKALQAVYRIRTIRKDKDAAIGELRKLLRDTLAEFSKINVELPKVRQQKPVPEPVKRVIPPPQPKPAPPPQDTELDKLAAELNAIEDQLRGL